MKKIRLTESELVNIVKRIVSEQLSNKQTIRTAAGTAGYKNDLPKKSPKISKIVGTALINGTPAKQNQEVSIDDSIELSDNGKISFYNIDYYGVIQLTKKGGMLTFNLKYD